MPNFNVFRYLSLLLTLGVFSYATQATEPQVIEPKIEEGVLPLQDIRTFTDIFERIRSSYVEEVDDKTLFEYAINGMLSSLDPHSAYLQAEDFADLQEHTSGKFGGLGIEVSMEDGLILVISPIDDTPAQKAGIQAGDLIVSIDDEAIMGMTLKEAIDRMRGEVGSPITLEVRRKSEKELLTFKLKRDEISVTSVRTELLNEDIGYIRITQFQENTGIDLVTKLNEWAAEGNIKGLVLDLRNNPGGVLDAAVEVVDSFIDEGLIVYTEGRAPNSKTTFEASHNTPAKDVPIVVLINAGSASASEIVAGALQDHKRAAIVGTQSFGKGSVQSVLPLTEDSAVKLTTARYFTPNGRSIQAQGIRPDIWVEQSEVTPYEQRTFKESNLPGHLRNNKDGEPTEDQGTSEKDASSELLKKDFQLYEAYTLLRGVNILSRKE